MKLHNNQIYCFLLISVFSYAIIEILPNIFVSLDVIDNIIRGSLVVIVYCLLLFSLFREETKEHIRPQTNNYWLLGHCLCYIPLCMYLVYLVGLYPLAPLKETHFLRQLLSPLVPHQVEYLTIRFRIVFLFLAASCHFCLYNALFNSPKIYRKYLLAFPLAILASDLSIHILSVVVLYSLFKIKDTLHKGILTIATALILMLSFTLYYNQHLWPAFAKNVATVNFFLLQLCGFEVVLTFPIGNDPLVGTTSFFAHIAYPCAGLEGLTTIFLALLALFASNWKNLYKFRAVVTLALGLSIMYTVNIARIFVLILIGHYYDSKLAVHLWHSYGAFFLYAFVIILIGLFAQSWCVEKNKKETPQTSLEKKVQGFSQIFVRMLRLPLDLCLLFVHIPYVNFMKTLFFQRTFKRNCQCYNAEGRTFCSVSRYYGSPQFVKSICKDIDTSMVSELGNFACHARPEKAPFYLGRSFASFFCILTILAGLVVGSWNFLKWYQKHRPKLVSVNDQQEKQMKKMFKKGKDLFEQKKYDEAEMVFLRILQLDSQHAQTYVLYGHCLERKKQFIKAFNCYRTAVQLQPDIEAYAQIRLAYLFARTGNFKKTRQIVKRVQQQTQQEESNQAECLALLALCDFYNSDLKSSKKLLQQAQKLNPNLDIIKFLNALYLEKNNNIDKAIKLYKALLENYDFRILAGSRLANIYLKIGKANKAEQMWRKLSRSTLEARLHLAKIYFQTKKTSQALQECQILLSDVKNDQSYTEATIGLLVEFQQNDKALDYTLRYLKKYPYSPSLNLAAATVFLRHNLLSQARQYSFLVINHSKDKTMLAKANDILGKIHLKNGQLTAAIDRFNKVVNSFPKLVKGYHTLALALRMEKQHQRALEILHQALKLKNNAAQTHLKIAEIYFLTKEYSKAVVHVKKAIAQQKDFWQAKTFLGITYEQAAKIKEAKKTYWEVVKKYPGRSAVAANNLAEILIKEGKHKIATQLAYQAFNQTKSVVILDTLAWALYNSGKLKKAKEFMEHVVKVLPKNGKAHYRYAVVLMALKDNKATAQFQNAIKKNPQGSFVKDARKRLLQLQKK